MHIDTNNSKHALSFHEPARNISSTISQTHKLRSAWLHLVEKKGTDPADKSETVSCGCENQPQPFQMPLLHFLRGYAAFSVPEFAEAVQAKKAFGEMICLHS